ncbi:short-chain dehydrogenases/reductase [Penicillium pulvis]|uniref:short-chain dehydrogenases/reductase n=1 Tax=Penicillium pulvis TaxID=1562058 RepID=UPI002549109A|nr:short-chain dehydrogenases/reductase [Penicillium pulvis]KAJ5784880.1 short-chain dehydrogenases/reductase [Penicillium pulvis]
MAQTLTQIRNWNATLKTARPNMVALFVGGTGGIGRSTAVKLAAAVATPTIYIVGRNEKEGAEVMQELKSANNNGTYSFLSADASHLREVDAVCQKLKPELSSLDLLFMTIGGLSFSKIEGDNNIDVNHILRYYSRMRFIQNLTPALEASKSPRVVSILGGGKEIKIEEDNLDLKKSWSFTGGAGYASSMVSVAHEKLASENPSISFIHGFPGVVSTPLFKKFLGPIFGSIVGFLSTPLSMSASESGEWHIYLSTAEQFKSKDASGNGSYILNYDGKDLTNEAIMTELREKDFPTIVWKHTLDTFEKLA